MALLLVACAGQEPPPRAAPAPPPPKDPPGLARIASSCARVSACAHTHDPSRFRDPGACVEWWVSETPDPLRQCLSAATTCDQVATCMHGGGDAKAAAFCTARPGVVSGCDGDRLVSCGDDAGHESNVVDCAAMGATCKELKTAGLVVRACFSPQKCPAGAPDTRCDGSGAVISCRGGAYERVVCRAGTTCLERRDDLGDPGASCEPPNRHLCDARGSRRCEDDRLVECSAGKAKVTECAASGLRCAGLGPRAGCYVPDGVECDASMLPRCDGASIAFCAAGRITKVACASLGLRSCDPAGQGPMAACTNR